MVEEKDGKDKLDGTDNFWGDWKKTLVRSGW